MQEVFNLPDKGVLPRNVTRYTFKELAMSWSRVKVSGGTKNQMKVSTSMLAVTMLFSLM